MKIRTLLNYTDETAPNVFPEAMKLLWLNEVEGRIQLDVLLKNPGEATYYSLPEDEDRELLLPTAYTGIYRTWMKAQVHRANGNTAKYENEMQLFNNAWNEYACRHAETGGR